MNPLISSYLKYIGFFATPHADLETLKQLHILHTLKIPFENLNPFLDMPVSLELSDLIAKMVENKRGGYCFEHNTLFLKVLKEIGFKAKGLGARVLYNQDENLITRRSHMLIAIEIDQETYLADVGFGGLTLTTPILFKTGLEQATTHEMFRVESIEHDYKLQAKIKDVWKTLYRFDLQEQYAPDYGVVNYYLSTHPESPFKTGLIAAKPTQEGRLALKNNQLTTYNKAGEALITQLTTEAELKRVLQDVFHIQLPVPCELGKIYTNV
jgi:N-hydroxyarylamine O-acetyltransferase